MRFIVRVNAAGEATILRPREFERFYIAEETNDPTILRLLDLYGHYSQDLELVE